MLHLFFFPRAKYHQPFFYSSTKDFVMNHGTMLGDERIMHTWFLIEEKSLKQILRNSEQRLEK